MSHEPCVPARAGWALDTRGAEGWVYVQPGRGEAVSLASGAIVDILVLRRASPVRCWGCGEREWPTLEAFRAAHRFVRGQHVYAHRATFEGGDIFLAPEVPYSVN